MAGTYTDTLVKVAASTTSLDTYRGVSGYELMAFDTHKSDFFVLGTEINLGTNPQSVAFTAFQLAALASYMDINTANESGGGGGAATLSTLSGRVVATNAGSTGLAAGASRTLTITNTACTTSSIIQCAIVPGTTTRAGMVVQSVTAGAGSFVVICYNSGPLAMNGTWVLVFDIEPNQT